MSLFHDEEDDPGEPVRGLPEALPAGERLTWQGKADPLTLAVHAFHIRTITLYLGLAAIIRASYDATMGKGAAEIASTTAVIALMTGLAVAVLGLMAFAMARRAVFTVTDKRVVIRHGVALKKYINIPFADIEAASIRRHAGGAGDIALSTSSGRAVPYFHLWPFARPMRFTKTVPLLRSVSNVEAAAKALATAMSEAAPEAVKIAPKTRPDRELRPEPVRGALNPEASLS
jgi:hypothetical protein